MMLLALILAFRHIGVPQDLLAQYVPYWSGVRCFPVSTMGHDRHSGEKLAQNREETTPSNEVI